MLEELLRQIEGSAKEGKFYLALFGSLALPSICGALESQDGRDTKSRYAAWFDRWIGPTYDGLLTGEQCYSFRCAMLHQGRAIDKGLRYSRVLFVHPSVAHVVMHRNVLNGALNLDVQAFCADMVGGARRWHATVSTSPHFMKNSQSALQTFPEGFPPYIVGVPVITSGGPIGPVTHARRPVHAAGQVPPADWFVMGLPEEAFTKVAGLSSKANPAGWASQIIRDFCHPYFQAWIELSRTGRTELVDPETKERFQVSKEEMPMAMIYSPAPGEKLPHGFRLVAIDHDLLVPMERAFQFTTLIDARRRKHPRWATVNEMASTVVEDRLRSQGNLP